MAEAWTKIGTLRKSKTEGKDNYIAIEKGVNITLSEGDVLSVQDPRKKLDAAVKAGRMDAEKAEELKGRIPAWVLREVYLTPKR